MIDTKSHAFFMAAILIALSGCSGLRESHQPPKSVVQAWSREDASPDQVRAAMKDCGYKDVVLANDISAQAASDAESCMKGRGFKLDLSSYRPNNCYGKNSPYLCKALWNGETPKLQPAGGAMRP